ncbi:MAG: NYN domain-containing protein [Peptoniphilus sp.]|nr:NYN domain-containing protein [Peptoniphilus sp.]MDD7363190.1 NYN domain-containing protein [Bacillota bacterium]MDY6044486.1 NYN domain-containing protein [Peptoniphilus sp.]
MVEKRKYKRTQSYLFVDGYNIINAWDDFKDMTEDRLEEARELLVDIMEEYAAMEHVFVILVFDAYRVKGNGGAVESREHMDIVFTKETVTADRYIESEIASMGGRMNDVSVATSDYVEQQIIMARGGKRISARELELMVKSAKGRTRKTAHRIGAKEPFFSTLDEQNKKKLERLKKKLT